MRDEAKAFLRYWGVEAEMRDFQLASLFQGTSRMDGWREGISSTTFARLGLCARPSGYKTHIVLDGDTLVGGDLDELAAIQPATLAAVATEHSRKGWSFLYDDRSLPQAKAYFNAGLLVLDPAFWRDLDVETRCLSLVNDRRSDGSIGRPLHDQEILNLVFGEVFHRLDARWNFMPKRSWDRPNLNPSIVHFAGRTCPWDRRDSRSLPVFRQIYEETFARMPKALAPAIEALALSDKNLRRARRFKPWLGRANRDYRKAWNPRHAPVVAHWASRLPWHG
jgi:lipopolysaccharide biosynthesis glycosyltransferase